ncbi:ATP synthase gamma chain [Gammaproteobacteria bacterium]
MASLRELRRRIKSAENIRGITKAMEIISAVRYKKFTARYRKATAFFANLERILVEVASDKSIANNPLFVQRGRNRELLLVITGERGLCGSFNSSIMKELMKYLASARGRQVALYPIGKISVAFTRRRGLDIWKSWADVGHQFTPDSLKGRINEIVAAFLSGEFDEVNVLTVSLSRAGTSKPILEPLLNLSYLLNKKTKSQMEVDSGYIFEPDAEIALKALTNLFIKQKIFILLLKSITAEYFARMVAMKQATENGKDVIKRLALERNKVRQAMITRELSEIIGGADALK